MEVYGSCLIFQACEHPALACGSGAHHTSARPAPQCRARPALPSNWPRLQKVAEGLVLAAAVGALPVAGCGDSSRGATSARPSLST